MVEAADRNRVLVADLSSERARLGEADVMRLGGGPAADDAGLSGDELAVLLVAQPDRLGHEAAPIRLAFLRRLGEKFCDRRRARRLRSGRGRLDPTFDVAGRRFGSLFAVANRLNFARLVIGRRGLRRRGLRRRGVGRRGLGPGTRRRLARRVLRLRRLDLRRLRRSRPGASRLRAFRLEAAGYGVDGGQSRLKARLDQLGVSTRQRVLEGQVPEDPIRRLVGGLERVEVGDQSVAQGGRFVGRQV